MKNLFIFIIFIFLLLNLFFMLKYRYNKSNIEVLAIRGKCFVFNSAAKKWDTLKSNSVLTDNSKIKTRMGSALISVADGRIKLDKNTDVDFINYNKYKNIFSTNFDVNLKNGKIIASLKKFLPLKNNVQIHTIQGVMGIRGTIFSIASESKKGSVRISVKEGEIEFKSKDNKLYTVASKKGFYADKNTIIKDYDIRNKDLYDFEKFFLENSIIKNKNDISVSESLLNEWKNLKDMIIKKVKKNNSGDDKKINLRLRKVNISATKTEMILLKKSIINYYTLYSKYPDTLLTLKESRYYDEDGFLFDSWNNRYKYIHDKNGFSIRSPGPDKEYKTDDDIIVTYR